VLNDHLPGFLFPERHVCSADAVFYRVAEGRVLDHLDDRALRESHVEEPAPERALSQDVGHETGIARTE
jgi:hypothetical protein